MWAEDPGQDEGGPIAFSRGCVLEGGAAHLGRRRAKAGAGQCRKTDCKDADWAADLSALGGPTFPAPEQSGYGWVPLSVHPGPFV